MPGNANENSANETLPTTAGDASAIGAAVENTFSLPAIAADLEKLKALIGDLESVNISGSTVAEMFASIASFISKSAGVTL